MRSLRICSAILVSAGGVGDRGIVELRWAVRERSSGARTDSSARGRWKVATFCELTGILL